MDTSSSATITTLSWDSYSDVQSNQTGWDFIFPWTSRQLNILQTLSWMRFGIIVTNILANTYTLFLQIRHKLYLRPSYIFAITLTTADLTFSYGLGIEWYFRLSVPRYATAIVSSSGTLSISSATAVAVDRYLALHAIPLEYKQFITVKKYAFAAFLVVMFSAACGCTIAFCFPFGHAAASWYSFFLGVVFTSATIALYLALGRFLSKSQTKLQLPPKAKMRRLRQTRKIMITFLAIVVTNLILLLPNYLFGLYVALQPADKQYTVYLNVLLANMFYNVQVANYTVNPLIYTKRILRPYLPKFCQSHGKKSGRSPNSDTDKGEDSVITNAGASVYSVSASMKSVPT